MRVFSCDGCGLEAQFERGGPGTFMACVSEIKHRGWRIIRDDGDWSPLLLWQRVPRCGGEEVSSEGEGASRPGAASQRRGARCLKAILRSR
jgi:hypothetical protein